MFEARKTNLIRGAEFVRSYFTGAVLDVGCGPDLVVPHARPFDQEHGDANIASRFLEGQQFDCVHSSHCLEHMRDPAAALADWWSLVKPGGHLVLVVPDEDLYEQGYWPSLFNSDHKWTFRRDGDTSWSPVSLSVKSLVTALPAAEVQSLEIHDHGYDRSLIARGEPFNHVGRKLSWLRLRATARLARLGAPPSWFGHRAISRLERRLWNAPIDQTMMDASAQIQAVVRKRPQARQSRAA